MRTLGLVAMLTLACSSGVLAASGPVVVVPLEGGGQYRGVARSAIALRRVLASRGHVVSSAATALRPRGQASQLAQAEAKLKEGVEHYDSLDFKQARAAFAEAVDLYRQALREGHGVKGYVKALHYLAAASQYDNDHAAAVQLFVDSYSFRPKQTPDNAVFPPDLLKVYEDAIAAATERGSLHMVSNPPAEVLLNGRAIGATPGTKGNLVPGNYLVTCRRAGYEPDAQWIAVQPGGKAEVRTELKPLPQQAMFARTANEVKTELTAGVAGAATRRLAQMLHASVLVLVARQGAATVAVWVEGGKFTKRYQAQVVAGGEREFAVQFVSTGAAPRVGGCGPGMSCSPGQRCTGGRCVAREDGTPFYKTWWFWTVVGVVVAGGATGAVLAVTSGGDNWEAELRPGGMR